MNKINRLWGNDSQNSVKNSKICFIDMSDISKEIIRNCVLYGINQKKIIKNRDRRNNNNK